MAMPPPVPAGFAVPDFTLPLNVDDELRAAIANGKVFDSERLSVEGEGPFAMIDVAGNLVAVYERSGERLKPSVVLPDPLPDPAPVASSGAEDAS